MKTDRFLFPLRLFAGAVVLLGLLSERSPAQDMPAVAVAAEQPATQDAPAASPQILEQAQSPAQSPAGTPAPVPAKTP